MTLDQPQTRLSIIGEGPEQDALIKLIHDLSLEDRISVHSFFQQHDDVIARLKASKVFVLPSTREGFGITALESLACGVPIVTIDHPENAIRDLITVRNGFLSMLSAEDLSKKICLALAHHEEMRVSCRESAASYDWNKIVSEVETLYFSLIRSF